MVAAEYSAARNGENDRECNDMPKPVKRVSEVRSRQSSFAVSRKQYLNLENAGDDAGEKCWRPALGRQSPGRGFG